MAKAFFIILKNCIFRRNISITNEQDFLENCKPMIKINITVHSSDSTTDASEITRSLKDENFRGVKVKQAQSEPEPGSLDITEYLPLIELLVQSGFAAAFVAQLFGLLKDGFFTKSKEIASNERIEMKKIEAEREKAKIEQQQAYLELVLEHGNEKHHLKITQENEAKQKEILDALLSNIKEE